MAVEPENLEQAWAALEALHARALELLADMDRLRLHEPAAYLSMAVDSMRRRHPGLRAE